SRIASSSAYRPPNAWARILGALTCAGKLPATLTRSHPHQRSSDPSNPASPQLRSPLKSASPEPRRSRQTLFFTAAVNAAALLCNRQRG
ncbi:MAG TPA: hypothetical protein VJ011_08610, partial [Steroidobacteraceae bacterium]|nr:hypothetical protein [Steroidobacteraceae bacterium]